MNYTKGPWENGTVGDRADRNGRQIYAKKVNLATCHYGGTDTPCVEESSANARLIAAAPDMYELIRREYAKGNVNKKDADAILAKIEGRSEK